MTHSELLKCMTQHTEDVISRSDAYANKIEKYSKANTFYFPEIGYQDTIECTFNSESDFKNTKQQKKEAIKELSKDIEPSENVNYIDSSTWKHILTFGLVCLVLKIFEIYGIKKITELILNMDIKTNIALSFVVLLVYAIHVTFKKD